MTQPGIRSTEAVKMLLEEEICSLISEAQDFNLSTIERIELPTALEFHRYVAANRPVIIALPPTATTLHPDRASRTSASSTVPSSTDEKGTKDWAAWSAFTKWTNEYLSKTLGDKEITVACTPTGWADAVVDDTYFAMPCEKKMTFEQFLEGMPIRTRAGRKDYGKEQGQLEKEKEKEGGDKLDPYQEVRYIQLQNGNLMTEYEELMGDVPADIPFANEALGKEPDAVNFWYGDERSTTSLHKDHYENLYAVIAGKKIFSLIPPTEQFCLHEKPYIAATYVESADSTPTAPRYNLEPLDPPTQTQWIALNPSAFLKSNTNNSNLTSEEDEEGTKDEVEALYEKYPRFRMCQPFRVELCPGEILYLPAMWYHQVEQEPDHEGKCIAVNWWYDMGFEGDRFAQAGFMSNLIKLVNQIEVRD